MEKPVTAKIYRDDEGKHTLVHEMPYSEEEGPFRMPPLPPGWYTVAFVDGRGHLYLAEPLIEDTNGKPTERSV